MSQFRSSGDSRVPVLTLDVRRDDSDARDYVFAPFLSMLPARIDNRHWAPVRDQGAEGACVGFALATVINVSLSRRKGSARRRRADLLDSSVSPRMLYEIGRRYDEW